MDGQAAESGRPAGLQPVDKRNEHAGRCMRRCMDGQTGRLVFIWVTGMSGQAGEPTGR